MKKTFPTGNWSSNCWKLNSPWGKCLKKDFSEITSSKFEIYLTNEEKTTVEWEFIWWINKSPSTIGVLLDKQTINLGRFNFHKINESFYLVDSNFICCSTNSPWGMQLSTLFSIFPAGEMFLKQSSQILT